MAGADPKTAFAMNGLLDELEKAFAERALIAEIDHHLDNGEEDSCPTSQNGYGRKSVLTETGKIELEVPRDRLSTYDPQLIAKYQQRFPGFDTQHRGTLPARGVVDDFTQECLALVVDTSLSELMF
jgi:putative transposase